MSFVKCLFYLASISFLGFLLGRILPKGWFRYDAFPYKSLSVERNGLLYSRLGIRSWKSKLPDMSVIFRDMMPSKAVLVNLRKGQLVLMLQETCVAEFIHSFLAVLGFFCTAIWKTRWGLLVSLLYMIGNIPFCLVQRYNRPKLVRLLEKLKEKGLYTDAAYPEDFELELQYEARI